MSALRQAATGIAERLRGAGFECYFAGGCVRDRLLGEEPHDIDIATSAHPEQVQALFPGKSFGVGAHFGVVLVRRGGFSFDVATFRCDGAYADSRHPQDVTFSDARHDALRRDFTVNGLFEDPVTGDITDFVNGLADLDARLIRAIGHPGERFAEDALRLMRAVRFAVTKGFDIEEGTMAAIREQSGLLGRISVERIRDEFDRILLSPARKRGVELLTATGLMDEIMPEWGALAGCEQPPRYHPEGDVMTHTMLMLGLLEPDASLPLVLAVLLHDIGKPATSTVDDTGRIRFSGHARAGAELAEQILRRLRYPNRVVADVVCMVSRHMDFMNVTGMRPATLRRFMDSPVFDDELELHRVDCLSSHGMLDHYDFVREARARFADEPVVPAPLVTGSDLIAAGYAPGPRFKQMLQWALDGQMEGRFATRQEGLAAVARQFPLE